MSVRFTLDGMILGEVCGGDSPVPRKGELVVLDKRKYEVERVVWKPEPKQDMMHVDVQLVSEAYRAMGAIYQSTSIFLERASGPERGIALAAREYMLDRIRARDLSYQTVTWFQKFNATLMGRGDVETLMKLLDEVGVTPVEHDDA